MDDPAGSEPDPSLDPADWLALVSARLALMAVEATGTIRVLLVWWTVRELLLDGPDWPPSWVDGRSSWLWLMLPVRPLDPLDDSSRCKEP